MHDLDERSELTCGSRDVVAHSEGVGGVEADAEVRSSDLLAGDAIELRRREVAVVLECERQAEVTGCGARLAEQAATTRAASRPR